MSDNHAATTDLTARVQHLELENHRLRTQLDTLVGRLDQLLGQPKPEAADEGQQLDRRRLLKRAGAVALGATAATVTGAAVTAPAAAAADGQPLLAGRVNYGQRSTTFTVSDAFDDAGLGVMNRPLTPRRMSSALWGDGVIGVMGTTIDQNGRAGVLGVFPYQSGPIPDADKCGVGGVGSYGNTGTIGSSDSGNGVVGRSGSGRGAVFSGGAAPLRLLPSTLADPPVAAETGDFFVTAGGQLWFCKRGGSEATWSRLTIN